MFLALMDLQGQGDTKREWKKKKKSSFLKDSVEGSV